MRESDTIISEKIRILFERAFYSNITAIAASIIFAYVFKEGADIQVISIWLGYMFAAAAVRFWVINHYNKHIQACSDHAKYENWFAYSTGAVGLGWASFLAFGLSSEYFEYRIYSLLLLVGIISIAVNIFSTSIKTLYFYLLPSFIISILVMLFRDSNDIAIIIALIIFVLMALRSYKDVSNTVEDALELRLVTQTLLDKLIKLEDEKSSSEKRMQGIMDYAPAAIYVKDLEGRFTFLNKKVADLHNMPHEDMLGKTLYDIFPKDIADIIHNNDLEVIREKRPLEFEEIAPHYNDTRHYLTIKFPLYTSDGEVNAVGGISTDITDRVRMEESLNINQQRVLLHREQSPVGVIEWNTNFEFLDWNPAAQKIFGFTRDEVLGKHITRRILPESAREEVDKVWEDLITNKGGAYSLNENMTKDGRIIMCEWHNTPLIDQDGKVIGVTSLVEDVTERKRIDDNLRHTQKMEAVGKLTGGIAHDFNNMLGVILGFTQLLSEKIDQSNPKLVKYCEQIIHASENAKKLTSKLLKFSSKDIHVAEITDINKSLEDMRLMMEKTLTARINFQLELQDDIYPLWLDKAGFEDTIVNMSINAMHAMPDGGTLSISTKNVYIDDFKNKGLAILPGAYVLLSITDSGIGMSEEVIDKIFDPFFTTKKDGGTGLGMSQVYGFVKQSGGEIVISSKVSEGTKIEMYFPKYHGQEVTKIESIESYSELPGGNEIILVVDDETSLLTLTTEILTHYGYKVYCAENGEQALELLKTTNVDLMLSDVIMPGMDGYQLASKVNEKYPNIKIQMTSGYTGDAIVSEFNKEWHEKRLPKPLSSVDLLLRVRMLLDDAE